MGDDFHQFYCKWEAPYQPGELLAVAYTAGQETGRYTLRTAQNAALFVHADKTQLRAGSSDLCFVEIELRDAAGTLDMRSDLNVSVRVEGAILAGCGTGNPRTEERFQDETHPLFEGRMLAVVKAGAERGTATIRVCGESLPETAVTIEIL